MQQHPLKLYFSYAHAEDSKTVAILTGPSSFIENPAENFRMQRLASNDPADRYHFEVWMIDGEVLPVTHVDEDVPAWLRYLYKDYKQIGTLNAKNTHCLVLKDGQVTPFGVDVARSYGIDPFPESLRKLAWRYRERVLGHPRSGHQPNPAPAQP